MAFIKARLVKQFFCLGNAFVARPAGVIRLFQRDAADIGLANQPCRTLSLPHHLIGDDIFIQPHVERPAHSGVIKGRFSGIEFVIVGRQLWRNVQLRAHRFLE